MSKPATPLFDYESMPYLPREGVQSEGNNRYVTVGLFLETAHENRMEHVKWCLSEHPIFCPALNRWIPSAWELYLSSKDEYDAMRKMVGNIHQWETLKKLDWFKVKLEMWQAEHSMKQRMTIRDALMRKVYEGGSGDVAAAKLLLEKFDTSPEPLKKRGRPAKQREEAEQPSAEIDDDMSRVLQFGKS